MKHTRGKQETLGCRMREHTSQREPTTAVREHIGMRRHKITDHMDEEVKVNWQESPIHGRRRSGKQWK